MNPADARNTVITSMVWLGIIAGVSQPWFGSIRDFIIGKVHGQPATPSAATQPNHQTTSAGPASPSTHPGTPPQSILT